MKRISRRTRRGIIISAAALLVVGLILNVNAFLPFVAGGYFLKEFLHALPDAIKKQTLNWLSLAVLRLILGMFIYWGVFSRYADICDHLPQVILMNPKLMIEDQNGNYYGNPPIESLVNAFIGIAQPFYVLAIISVAFYLLFVSGSPLGRARAKASLIRLILSMVLVVMTIPVIQLCLDVSEYLAGSILNMGDTKMGIEVMKEAIFGLWRNYIATLLIGYWPSVYLLMFSMVMFFIPFMIVGMRYFMILFFTALFPLTVLCYAFYFTRNMGGHIFRETFRWIFIQPLWALILVSVSVASVSMPLMNDATARMGFGLAAFIVFTIAPLIVVKVMDWLAMLMIILTSIEFAGMHGVVGMIDELQVEGPETEEITPPPPIRPRR